MHTAWNLHDLDADNLTLLQVARAENGDNLVPLACSGCRALVGSRVVSPGNEDVDSCAVRLLKYTSSPHDGEQEILPLRASLAAHVTAELLETGQAHACHRFVLEDFEEERTRLLVQNPL